MPHVICDNCFEILKTCWNFRVKTQQTTHTLRNILEGKIAVIKDEIEDPPFADEIIDDTSTEMKIESIEDSPTSFTCPYCSKIFVHRRNLQIHKQRHFMVGKYGCPSCTQRFHTKFDLLRHSSTSHLLEKPYQCDECAKTFPTKPELNRHQKLIHNPVKSFSCSECGMQFKLKANAKQHIYLVHSKERSHVCGMCGKAFAFAAKLRAHQTSKCDRSVRISVMKKDVVEESS